MQSSCRKGPGCPPPESSGSRKDGKFDSRVHNLPNPRLLQPKEKAARNLSFHLRVRPLFPIAVENLQPPCRRRQPPGEGMEHLPADPILPNRGSTPTRSVAAFR